MAGVLIPRYCMYSGVVNHLACKWPRVCCKRHHSPLLCIINDKDVDPKCLCRMSRNHRRSARYIHLSLARVMYVCRTEYALYVRSTVYSVHHIVQQIFIQFWWEPHPKCPSRDEQRSSSSVAPPSSKSSPTPIIGVSSHNDAIVPQCRIDRFPKIARHYILWAKHQNVRVVNRVLQMQG